MVSFKVAIPSYNRYESLIGYTLSTILSKNIDPSCINIFVANEEQYELYSKSIPADMYNEIIITEKGKANAMNHIRRFYRKGQKLLNLDDDISEIYYHNQNSKIPLNDLNEYSKYIFKIMKIHKIGLCGVNRIRPKSNTLSINNHPSDGGIRWIINNPSKKLDILNDANEDREFCLRNVEYYGNTILNNEISIIDESRNENSLNRMTSNKEYAVSRYNLLSMFPHLLQVKPQYKSEEYQFPIVAKRRKGKIIHTVVKKW